MTAHRKGLELALMIGVGVALFSEIGRALRSADRRGRIRLLGASNGSTNVAFAVMEDLFSRSASHAPQVFEGQRRMAHRDPTPGTGTGQTTGHRSRAGSRAS
jgi:hypothetical protein